ncbi:MAG TPA: hypothetical protein VH143_08985 [Kofleriaceae bacterium]|jgi:hypothetical protein|nr:hypothetical protein [Kofleriaceae bacterium]
MRSWCLAIFIAVFAGNMLVSSREPAWGDARPMWELADRIVEHGALDIKTRWPDDIPAGPDGKTYGIAAIGCALVHIPGAAIAALAHEISPGGDALVRPICTHLAPSVLGALACVLFFLLLIDLGITTRTAGICTAILATATTTAVYAHYAYGDIVQLACFIGLFRAALRTSADPSRREALWLGAWAGMLVETKYVFAMSVVGAAVVIAWTLRNRSGELKRVAVWASIAGAPFAVLALAYNQIRWGSPLATGYGPYLGAYFGGSMLDGAWGMLLSPNKSAFLYSPPLVLAVIGMPAAFRAVPRLALAIVAMVIPTLIVYCTYRSWSGDYAWGPRYFVWAVPPLLVPIAWFVDRMTKLRKAALIAIVALGVAVQLLGLALYWDHFIRLASDAKNQWLGQPNRRGAYIAERGRGHCDSCFEDTYDVLWLPAFQPIRGHIWLLESLARSDDAKAAQADAPWRTYTSLDVNLEADWGRARVDWWGLLWLRDFPGTRVLGAILLLIFAAGGGLGIARWIRLQRMRE